MIWDFGGVVVRPLSSAEVSRFPLNSIQFSVVLRGIAEGNLCQKTRPNTQLTGGRKIINFQYCTTYVLIILHNLLLKSFNTSSKQI